MYRIAYIRLIVEATALLISSSCFAQQLIAPPSPRLVIATGAEQPVSLQAVKIETEISGSIAHTSVELLFHNPNQRQLEGELQFPLLDGQSVVGFAMELDGKLREAVPVEKARAEAVFEDITRAQIDPALLQATQGNNYKLRVYPILPQKTKRVVIRYLETLTGAQDKLLYRLPLNYPTPLKDLSLRLRVNEVETKPTVSSNASADLNFTQIGNAYEAQVERLALRGMMEMMIPRATKTQTYTQIFSGQTYFYTEFPAKAETQERNLPKLVGLLWDSSGSGALRNHARELALLDAYFKKAHNIEVRLIRLREQAETMQIFKISGGDWSGLRKTLEATDYDGASNLGAFTPDPAVTEYLLFSDGLNNFGYLSFPKMSVPIYTINTSIKAAPVFLRHIAERSGGRYIDLLTDSATQANEKLLNHSTRILRTSSRGAKLITTGSYFPKDGRLAITGILTEPVAQLEVQVGLSQERAQVLHIPIRSEQPFKGLAALMWAQFRLAELEAEYELNRAEIQRLGKTFNLVTRETSLIVLDRVEDYVRYEITPPAELYSEYQRLLASSVRKRADERGAHLEKIVRLFQEKQVWWKREFPKDEPPARSSPSKINDGRRTNDLPREETSRGQVARPALPSPSQSVNEPTSARLGDAYRLASEKKADGKQALSIRLKKWTPDAPYSKRMQKAKSEELYRVYLNEKANFLDSTAFFLDTADIFFDKGLPELAVRVLSNLAEMDLENRHILRILGLRLLQAGQAKLAIPVFEKVLELSPEEPQSYRDLGLAYAADGQYQKAVDSLYEVVTRPWHGRFPEVELIALAELNAIASGRKLDTSKIDSRLLKNIPLDLRVVLTWDADNTDIDLWVTDPNGERAFYRNRLTYQGGRMSADFTGGYGPEEFSLKSAKPGKYKIEAQFYGHRQQIVAGATTLQVSLITKFATREQQEKRVTLRLKGQNEVIFVGEFEVN